ncbi:response regulator [Azospirillum sp. RWY-5-1]|uniref:histidine kinase n=1 Tax=Azospirillum oleiclasticum TaxID=2735135 RepID=A0ABX2THU7_9PROT|nr:ATP-binding protein [Azospirillum oleiclasticum]NYZ15601.1 response regulator [Azospirillum oleiclasticum]NYZ22624.1 response regulator [Azospirillum oleiclasticum]
MTSVQPASAGSIAGTLAGRFALAAAALSVGLAMLVGAVLQQVSSQRLAEQHRSNVESNAALVARQTQGLLDAIAQTIAELADNSVLATALVDSAGKETYLLPFLASFERVSGVPLSIVFTDFEGTPIAGNGHTAITDADLAWLRTVMIGGRHAAVVRDDGGGPYLLAAEMLIYSRTASPEGALLYRVPFQALVLQPDGQLLHAGSAPPPAPGPGRIAVDVPVRVPDHLAPLALSLRLEAAEASAGATFASGVPAYAAVGIAALVAVLMGSRAVGRRLTRPLRELERVAATIVQDGFSGQRAVVRRADEVGSLARAFNAMLDHIAAIQRERERQAAEEIATQRTLAGQAEEARREAVAALATAEQAIEAKTRFLAAASHDLRQPVQSLVLLSSALASRLANHPAAVLVDTLQASVDALCRLLEALLDVSKLDAGVVSADPRPVRMAEVVERLESEYRLRTQAKGIGLRAVPSSLVIHTDRDLLERILRNLLENALRYTDRGGILIGCRRRGDSVLIQVVDTGSGIPPEHLDRIFHEFYQVSNPARDRGLGLGLGLAIVERLVRLLDGRIHVTSTPDRGSCFSIEFRRSANDGADTPQDIEVAGPPASARPGLALLIDDDPLVRKALAVLIEQAGWRVLTADGLPAALHALSSSPEEPSLIIADYRLGDGTTGLDTLHAVHARLRNRVMSVILTGDTAPDQIVQARNSGIHILHKPIAARDVAALLAEASTLAVALPG